MLKFKKFFFHLASAVALSTSVNATAEIIDTFESGTLFHLLEGTTEAEVTTYTVYEYDLSVGGSSVTSLFNVSGEPSAITYDGTNFFITEGTSLRSYNRSGTATFIRNLVTDAKRIISAGDFLIILLGSPDNAIITVNKNTGALVDRTPSTLDAEDMFEIHDIFLDSDDNRIVAQIASAGDIEADTQYMEAGFTESTGALAELTAMTRDPSYSGFTDAPNSMSEPFFLDDLEVAIDASGFVVDFSDSDGIRFSHGDLDAVDALSSQLVLSYIFATDGVIDSATDDTNYAYFAMTTNNICNPIGTDGTRLVRHAKSGPYLYRSWNGYLEDTDHYYDTTISAHTIVASGGRVFLFYGEGSELAVETVNDGDFTADYHPWRNANYDPASANMSNVRQSTSFAISDTEVAMQIEDGCDHYVGFWNTTTNSFRGYTETFWFDPIDGAYVSGLDRFFLAFTDGTNYWIRHLPVSESESEDETNLAISDGFGDSEIHQIIDAGNFLVISLGSGDDATVRSYNLADDDDDITDVGVMELSFVNQVADGTVENCCDAWTGGIYSSTLDRIFYTTSEGLFAIEFETDGSFGGLDDGAALQSIDFGTIQTIPESDPTMSLNDDQTRLFLAGEIYDTSTLRIVDSVPSEADVGLFIGSNLYTYDSESSLLQEWDLSGGLLEETSTDTTLSGTISALLPITEGSETVTLTLEETNGELAITVDGDTEDAASTGSSTGTDSGSDDDDTGDSDVGTDDDEDTSSSGDCPSFKPCVEAPGGGSGGGPIDFVLIAGLLGLAIRVVYKPSRQ
ncbi:MAG: hypothetical protein MI867_09030 [Pseudomonadales bacterium]|nr:hypothetical protein [Pseudomonadales bacterium]